MARDWMRDRGDMDRDERRSLRGDWDRDRGVDWDRDRWRQDMGWDRDEGRSVSERSGRGNMDRDRGWFDRDRWQDRDRDRSWMGGDRDRSWMGGDRDRGWFDRDRNDRGWYGGDRGFYDRLSGRTGYSGDFDRPRWEGRSSYPSSYYGGGSERGGGYYSGGYGANMGGGIGYGGYPSHGTGYGNMSRQRLRGEAGRGDWDRDYRNRDERGFFQRVGDWFNDMSGGEERRGRGPRGYVRSDERIRDDVYDRLMENAWVDATEVEVKVSSGEVTLTGTVPSRHDKRTIEDIAETVLGVKEVHNQLRRQDRTMQAGSTTSTTSTRSGMSSGMDNGGPRRDQRT